MSEQSGRHSLAPERPRATSPKAAPKSQVDISNAENNQAEFDLQARKLRRLFYFAEPTARECPPGPGARTTKHVRPNQLLQSMVDERRELILEGLRGVSAELGTIRREVNKIGSAFKAGRITAGEALVAAERVAPGMFDATVLSELDAERFKDEILDSWEKTGGASE